MSTRERIERRLTRLRHDQRFDALLTESISNSPDIIKVVLSKQLDAEQLREFALRVIGVAFTREEDAKHEPAEQKYDEHVNTVMGKLYGEGEEYDVAPLAEIEQREALRALFRWAHASLRATMTKEEAWHAFAALAPDLISDLVAFMKEA